MKNLLLLILCAGLVGCATAASRTNNLSLGMTKQDVIKVMGNPSNTQARENIEVLEYWLNEGGYLNAQYWVYLQNGKVVQYGKAGAFGTAIPDKQQIDVNWRNQ